MAFNFTGTNQYIQRTGAVLTAPPLTMACWFKSNGLNNSNVLSLCSSTQADQISLQPWSDGILYFTTTNNLSGVFAGTAYSANVWTHACGVTPASNSRTVYRDGGNSASNSGTQVPHALNLTMIGGANFGQGPSNLFHGDIAEAGIWNVVLDTAEIAALAKGFSPLLIRPASLVFYWPGVRDGTLDIKGAPLTVTNATVSNHPRIIYPKRKLLARRFTTATGGGRTASIAATESADTAAVSAHVLVSGSIASTEANDQASIVAHVGTPIIIAATESADQAAISARVRVSGAIASTESADQAFVVARVLVSLSGALAEASDRSSAAASVAILASLAPSEADDCCAGRLTFVDAVVIDPNFRISPLARERTILPSARMRTIIAMKRA